MSSGFLILTVCMKTSYILTYIYLPSKNANHSIRSSMITGSCQLKKKKSQSATPHLWVIRASRQIAFRPYDMLKDR
ncbi:hypothetical protein ASPBRDRAFT_673284 [Aspergillus brasiliensis CBS 101740]|uniref:Uncharacterized protein n=1 Tax=Aspergillus brasiliensis (strain CBS 101740 / IMI 381727 / IBT 21946) TaxID=767769 RepID=A0A1L9UMI7_ASPBC|nr:hypothetical protein ASPBRDRAFT_673284 [Aspergillus brasiliensis CBS 101740]